MKPSIILSTAVLLLAGACSHYSEDLASLEDKISTPAPAQNIAAAPQDIAPAAGAMSAPATLNQTLASEFYTMAKSEQDRAYDYKAAKRYTEKAMKAKEGKTITPSKLSAFDIPAERRAPLEKARADLVAALQTQNTPDNAQNLAIAQCRYECWLERAEEAADEAHYTQCRDEFESAMAQLIAPAAGEAIPAGAVPANNLIEMPVTVPTVFNLSFAANSAVPDEASVKKIAHVINVLSAPDRAGYKATIAGFTGPAQGEFAQKTLEARVKTVMDRLVEGGVDKTRIETMTISDPAQSKVDIVVMPPPPAPSAQPKTEFVPVNPPVPVQ